MRMIVSSALAMLAMAAPAWAQGLPSESGPERTVKIFDLLCYDLLPDLGSVAEAAAAGQFTELQGEKLERYQPTVPAEELRAWSFDEAGSEFVLTTSRSKPDDAFKAEVPEFAGSTNFACSLFIGAKDPQEALLAEMETTLGREPDESWDQAPLRTHMWTGATDTMLVFVYYHAPLNGGPGGLLSANAFVNE